ncbi:MAG: protein kinase domain-containing protein [Burkholderiales bacterium]
MDKIGKYEIIRELGKGATSAVYLAQDSFAGRQVAIKLLRAEALQDKEYGRRFHKLFLTEASLAGKLSHPHIASIYDAVSNDEGTYLVMEYVEGETLEQHVKPDTLLPQKRVIEVVFKCCKALDHAHQHGIIHRDIKPANILLSNDSEIKITDFGAALSISSDTTQISGIGSPAYMSPEQLKEEPLTHQTDIFSLGVVMYQLLTGHLPFKGATGYSMAHQIITVEPQPPSVHRPDIPAAVEAIVMSALAKSPKDRFATWEQFANALSDAFINFQRPEDPVPETEKFSTLRRLEFFRNFADVDLWQVLRIAEWVKFGPESSIIREADVGTSFFILASGEVKVTKQDKLINILRSGDCFGEMAYLGRRQFQRTADVVAVDEIKVIEIKTEALENATESCRHAFNAAFLELLVSRLATANTRLSQLLLDRRISIF